MSLTSAHHLDPPLMLTHTHTHTKAQQREVWPGQSVGTELSQKRNNFGRKRKENSKNGGNFRPVASSRRLHSFLSFSHVLFLYLSIEKIGRALTKENKRVSRKKKSALFPRAALLVTRSCRYIHADVATRRIKTKKRTKGGF